MKSKRCIGCDKLRLVKFFQRHNKSIDGYSSLCVDCGVKRGRPSKPTELLQKQGTLRSREPQRPKQIPLHFKLKKKSGESMGEFRGRHAIEWMQRFITIPSGDYAGQPLRFDDWNEKIIRDLFGTVNKDGSRQYREAFIMIPRKNGKSFLASCIVLYALFNAPPNSEIYSVATNREQASLIFRMAKAIIEANEDLRGATIVIDYTRRIVHPQSGGFYSALSADVPGKFGANAFVVVYDELHASRSGELFDVMKKAQGAIKEPLMIAITTAGNDRFSFCFEKYQYAKRVSEGAFKDPTFYPCIYEIDESEWMEEAAWYRVNPALGKYRFYDEMKASFERALNEPSEEFSFKQYYLNLWVEGEIKFVSGEQWDSCPSVLNESELMGQPCCGGLDLASVSDVTAFVLVFSPADGIYRVLPFFYIPADTLRERVRKDRVKYDVWLNQGYVRATPGNMIDLEFIINDISQIKGKYNIKEIGFDRFGSPGIIPRLEEMGLKVIPFGQGFTSMSPPTKELQKLILSGKINHGGNPVMAWMIKNVVLERDSADNIKIAKDKSSEKVDGPVAMVMALDRMMRNPDPGSIYDKEGIFFL